MVAMRWGVCFLAMLVLVACGEARMSEAELKAAVDAYLHQDAGLIGDLSGSDTAIGPDAKASDATDQTDGAADTDAPGDDAAAEIEDDTEPLDADPCPPGKCDDGNPCTIDLCDADGKCDVDLVADDENCGDSGGKCKSGECVAGEVADSGPTDVPDAQGADSDVADTSKPDTDAADTAPDAGGCPGGCDDGNPCTNDSCGSSGCQYANSNGVCNDGNPCTSGDICDSGSCTPGTNICNCNSDIQCAKGEDGNLCNGTLFCDKVTAPYQCKVNPATIVDCSAVAANDGQCKTTSCNTQNGKCETALKADYLACDADGSACTDKDHCFGGTCTAGTKVFCDDGNACTTDSCDSKAGCQVTNTASGAACPTGSCDGKGSCVANGAPAGMVLIPGGTFWMGCNAVLDTKCSSIEAPQHKVTLSPYYMDATELTVAAYKQCVDAGGCSAPAGDSLSPLCNWNEQTGTPKTGRDQHPVNCVTWPQAQKFCKWRGSKLDTANGSKYDLPTEAQWEMAARGSCEKNGSSAAVAGCAAKMRTYPWGETQPTCTLAVMDGGGFGCGTNHTAPVAQLAAGASPYGLLDMAGNVEEWTLDFFGNYYPVSPMQDPLNTTAASMNAVRGGSLAETPTGLRSAYRSNAGTQDAWEGLGLRCARSYCTPELCDDGNPCTTDTCDGSDHCVHASSQAGKACTGGICDGNGTCIAAPPAGMTLVPAGTFWMGCNNKLDAACVNYPNEAPQHKVTLSAYLLDQTEVTAVAYQACVDAGGCAAPGAGQLLPADCNWDAATKKAKTGKELHPINCVAWAEAQDYCKWRGKQVDPGNADLYDLPTEAQWEMAARGSCEKNGKAATDDLGCKGAMRTYPWGEQTPTCDFAVMWNGQNGCGAKSTMPVGSKAQGDGPYGQHDLIGNIAEWTRDWFSDLAYSSTAAADPIGPATGTNRAIRGGDFYHDAQVLRAGYRVSDNPASGGTAYGLRCARAYVKPPP